MNRWVCLGAIVLAGCTQKAPQLPQIQPVPNDLAAFQMPGLYVPPPEPEPPPAPVAHKPPSANEKRYQWEDGRADLVQVGIRYPTVVRFQPGERITTVMDGDTEYMSETEEERQQPREPSEKKPNCHYGARWQYCKGVSEALYTPIEHLAFTTTHPGHKQGVVVFSDRRSYYLELQAVQSTKTRLVSWAYPPPPPQPVKPKPPGLFPDLAERREYHTGYILTLPDPAPDWTPISVYSDTKMYLKFSPTVLHQRMPLLRGIDHQGKPYVLNSRQSGNWVVVDELAPRLELRQGTEEHAQVVVITRGSLWTINCPGDAQCPIWPQ